MELSKYYMEMHNYVKDLQERICSALEKLDGRRFNADRWSRKEGGGGITKVIENGNIFEKGGVNTSGVYGRMSSEIARQLNVKEGEFGATGLSIVLHQYSPKIPTIHMNIRYFETDNGDHWFGGGIDLTPFYPNENDFKHFHKVLADACESVIKGSYKQFKKECDDYFTIKHRDEMRGIGGIFFDYLRNNREQHFELVKSVGEAFLESYLPIVKSRMNEEYTNNDKKFQLVRRGRYVEFNLVYDRGTVFGLRSGGRVESILMSLPPEVKYPYNWQPPEGSVYEKMQSYYQPMDWVNG